jgi:hypothetical protein
MLGIKDFQSIFQATIWEPHIQNVLGVTWYFIVITERLYIYFTVFCFECTCYLPNATFETTIIFNLYIPLLLYLSGNGRLGQTVPFNCSMFWKLVSYCDPQKSSLQFRFPLPMYAGEANLYCRPSLRYSLSSSAFGSFLLWICFCTPSNYKIQYNLLQTISQINISPDTKSFTRERVIEKSSFHSRNSSICHVGIAECCKLKSGSSE